MSTVVKITNILSLHIFVQGFHGGRCEGYCSYKEAQEDEQLHYVDFTSLYPAALKYDRE